MSNKREILEALGNYVSEHKPELRSVEVPELGTDEEPVYIYCREMTMAKFREIQKEAGSNPAEGEMLFATAVCCFTDENGLRLFKNKAQAKVLDRLHPNLLARIVKELDLGEEPEDEEGDVAVAAAEKKSTAIVGSI